jgi:hypothetical protein
VENKIYNTKSEIGLRCLFILKVLYPKFCSVDRLLYIDYLSLYIEDLLEDAINLHPKYPLRSIEAFERRQLLKQSIVELAFKGLISVENDNGLYYVGNSSTLWFVDSIKNDYSKHLLKNIELVTEKFKSKSDEEIKKIIVANAIKQENEFANFYPYIEEV